MRWHLRIANRARKVLGRLPGKDQQRILAALGAMCDDPFSGDVVRLKAQPTAWRRRVGDYRIFFDIDPGQLVIDVVEIRRRTSTTY
ncbi:MAG TPA: type II toxin-antitoxin system RelE/ParE family toxin [Blastocatellia bacterium]|nr:type II toxin-antitoxin system RelE/ParE family toxin [Blastocatellia bacterium]